MLNLKSKILFFPSIYNDLFFLQGDRAVAQEGDPANLCLPFQVHINIIFGVGYQIHIDFKSYGWVNTGQTQAPLKVVMVG